MQPKKGKRLCLIEVLPTEKIFTKEFGGAMAPRTPSDIFERFLTKYEMPKITFHQIRHTSVSLLINGGVQTQGVSKRAGHSSVSTINNIYSHVFQSIETQAANKMNEIFEKA